MPSHYANAADVTPLDEEETRFERRIKDIQRRIDKLEQGLGVGDTGAEREQTSKTNKEFKSFLRGANRKSYDKRTSIKKVKHLSDSERGVLIRRQDLGPPDAEGAVRRGLQDSGPTERAARRGLHGLGPTERLAAAVRAARRGGAGNARMPRRETNRVMSTKDLKLAVQKHRDE